MLPFLITIHLLIVLALIGVVLLQRSEGGLGLGGGGAGGGGVGGFLTGRGQANALTRATAILATAFFVTSLLLGIIAHRGSTPRSVFDQNTGTPTTGNPTGAGGGAPAEVERTQAPAAPISPAAPSQPQVPESR